MTNNKPSALEVIVTEVACALPMLVVAYYFVSCAMGGPPASPSVGFASGIALGLYTIARRRLARWER